MTIRFGKVPGNLALRRTRDGRRALDLAISLCCLGVAFTLVKGSPPESTPVEAKTASVGLLQSEPGALAIIETSSSRGLAARRGAAQTAPLKAVHFRITTLGIEPSELRMSPGRYFVAIDNDSGLNDVDLKIDKEGAARLGSAQLPTGRRKWRGYVDFTPGKYAFSDPNDVKRTVILTITEQ